MTFKTKIFNKIYEKLYLQDVKTQDEKELSKIMLCFLDNVTLDNDILLEQIEKEDSYKLRFNRSIKNLTKIEKEDLINEHIDFIVTSCCTVIEG